MLSKVTVVDGQQFTVGRLSNAEKHVHEELIIHLLESKVQRGLCVEGAFGISQEGPEQLDPTINEKEAMMLGVVHLEEGVSIPAQAVPV